MIRPKEDSKPKILQVISSNMHHNPAKFHVGELSSNASAARKPVKQTTTFHHIQLELDVIIITVMIMLCSPSRISLETNLEIKIIHVRNVNKLQAAKRSVLRKMFMHWLAVERMGMAHRNHFHTSI